MSTSMDDLRAFHRRKGRLPKAGELSASEALAETARAQDAAVSDAVLPGMARQRAPVSVDVSEAAANPEPLPGVEPTVDVSQASPEPALPQANSLAGLAPAPPPVRADPSGAGPAPMALPPQRPVTPPPSTPSPMPRPPPAPALGAPPDAGLAPAQEAARGGRLIAGLARAGGTAIGRGASPAYDELSRAAEQPLQDYAAAQQSEQRRLSLASASAEGDPSSPSSRMARAVLKRMLPGVETTPGFEGLSLSQARDYFPFAKEAVDSEVKKMRAGGGLQALSDEDASHILASLDPRLAASMGGHITGPQLQGLVTAGRITTMRQHESNQVKKEDLGAFRANTARGKLNLSLSQLGLQPEDVDVEPSSHPLARAPTKGEREAYDKSRVAVRRAMDALDVFEQKLDTGGIAGRLVPGTSAYNEAKSAAARLVPLINQVEGMTPGMPAEHQKLLHAQLMDQSSWTALLNPGALHAQIRQLRAALAKTPEYMRVQSGIRQDAPAETTAPPGRIRVSNGTETLEIDAGGEGEAAADGYRRVP